MKPYFIDDNEKILWTGKASKLIYFFNTISLFMIIFVPLWLSVVIFLLRKNFSSWNEIKEQITKGIFQGHFDEYYGIPIIIFALVTIILISIPILKIIESFRVKYYITDSRIYIESGIVSKKPQKVNYKKVKDLKVTVGPIAKIMNRGNIQLTPDVFSYDSDDRYVNRGLRLIGVENPHELYKLIEHKAIEATANQEGFRVN